MTFESFIPPRSKSVLEITGEVSKDFQTTEENFLAVQPDCKYKVAKNFSDIDGKFDTIILQSSLIGNLSHDELVELLKKSATKLNKRGVLILTLDNISFIENVMAILEGKPLKFKTTLSAVELEQAVSDANLKKFKTINAAQKTLIPQELKNLAKTNLEIFAYIVTATAEELPKKTLLQYSIGENLVCAPIRIHLPNSFFSTEPNISAMSSLGNPSKLFSDKEFDNRIFISQRITYQNFQVGRKIFEDLKNAGYLYVNEMDDHPVLWEKSYKDSGYINFVGVHAIQTSTKCLADYLNQFNSHVKVFPNQLRRLLPKRNFDTQNNKTVTIFFGALNRDAEFNELLPVLNQIAKDYGKRVAFKILARKNLFDSLQTENKLLIGNPGHYDGQFVPYSTYESTLYTSDIALLPLLDNMFNRAKSDLKFIECGNCGTAALASPVVYSEVVKDGVNGFIYRDLQDFSQKLRLLIDNADKRHELADNAYEYVKHNRLMSQHYEERLDWYNELFARLPELNKETEQRIEKIAPNFENQTIVTG